MDGIDPKIPIHDIAEQDILRLLTEIIEGGHLSQLLVLAVKDDGVSMACDNGLSIDEAIKLIDQFKDWLLNHKRKIV